MHPRIMTVVMSLIDNNKENEVQVNEFEVLIGWRFKHLIIDSSMVKKDIKMLSEIWRTAGVREV